VGWRGGGYGGEGGGGGGGGGGGEEAQNRPLVLGVRLERGGRLV
jgi:hypothetical protein